MGRRKKNRGARFDEGERAVRCQWQMKHGERVAAVKISSGRRKAARKFWVPQQEQVSTDRIATWDELTMGAVNP